VAQEKVQIKTADATGTSSTIGLSREAADASVIARSDETPGANVSASENGKDKGKVHSAADVLTCLRVSFLFFFLFLYSQLGHFLASFYQIITLW
jgi:hypothetical protein